MKRKVLMLTTCFAALLVVVLLLFSAYTKRQRPDADEIGEQIVAFNEINQLTVGAVPAEHADQLAVIQEKTDALQAQLRTGTTAALEQQTRRERLVLGGICLLFLGAVFLYLYVSLLRPFDTLQNFAKQIAAGNLNVKLPYPRKNYFGAFTWAFDSMRQEITKARACEREAVENNKTVIATLSHDIKTPIASICAYAEGLEANMDTTPEKRQRYLQVMQKKCGEVAQLTNDLFLHAISDLNRLQIKPERLELCALLRETIADIAAEQGDVSLQLAAESCYVYADRNRLVQIAENLINNARKYAQTDVSVSLRQQNGEVQIAFADHGSGLADADVPFLFDKFYRGANCGNAPGSGLGLYIVRYQTEQMRGRVTLVNQPTGLTVTVILPTAAS